MSIARINPVTGNREPVNMHNGPFDNPVHDSPSDEILVNGEWTPEVITKVEYRDVEVPPNEVRRQTQHWDISTQVVHPLAQSIMAELTEQDTLERSKQRFGNMREPSAMREMDGVMERQRTMRKRG